MSMPRRTSALTTYSVLATTIMLASGADASGGVMQMTQSKTWNVPLSPNTTMIEFDRFNDMGGKYELLNAEIRFTASASVEMTVENRSEVPVNEFAVIFGATMAVQINNLSADMDLMRLRGPISLAPSDDGGEGDGQGPDFFDLGVVEVGGSETDGGSIAGFSGLGKVHAHIEASARISVTSVPGTLTASNYTASGSATLIYTYVPAPTSAAMYVAALFGMSARRRRA